MRIAFRPALATLSMFVLVLGAGEARAVRPADPVKVRGRAGAPNAPAKSQRTRPLRQLLRRGRSALVRTPAAKPGTARLDRGSARPVSSPEGARPVASTRGKTRHVLKVIAAVAGVFFPVLAGGVASLITRNTEWVGLGGVVLFPWMIVYGKILLTSLYRGPAEESSDVSSAAGSTP